MDTIKSYRIECLNCGGERKIKMHSSPVGARIDWMEDGADHKIVSFRPRLDGEWGWQCKCGNDTLMTQQERQEMSNPTQPTPQEIDEIVKNLAPAPKNTFSVKEL